nr:hypothetical protein CFP56_42160 [Quercus suber]
MESCGWMGEDCKPVLERLGFKYAVSSEQMMQARNPHSHDEQAEVWDLPATQPVEDTLQADGSSPRELLEDVEFELLALMYKQASETGIANPCATEVWNSANHDVERTLAAQGCRSIDDPTSFLGILTSTADQRCLPSRRTGVANEVLPFVLASPPLTDHTAKSADLCTGTSPVLASSQISPTS